MKDEIIDSVNARYDAKLQKKIKKELEGENNIIANINARYDYAHRPIAIPPIPKEPYDRDAKVRETLVLWAGVVLILIMCCLVNVL